MTVSQAGSPKENHLLARLSPTAFEQLLPKLEWVRLTSGDVLHESGKRQEFAYFPATCIVALIHVTENGDSTLVAMAGREGVVGVVQVLGDGSMPIRSLVQTTGTAWRIKTQDFKKAFITESSLMEQCLTYTQLLMTHMAQLALCNRYHLLEQQLCRWLLFSLDRLNATDIHCTQELISSLLGVRRQGVAEAAAKLETEGVIDRRRGQITVLDRTLLEERSCECYRSVRREQDRLFSRLLPGSAVLVERRATESGDSNLLQRSQRLEMALQGSDLAWWDLYLVMGRSLVHYSHHWYHMLGFQNDEPELTTIVWDDRIHPDDMPARESAMQAYLTGTAPMFESEHRVRHKNGSWVWFSVRGKVAHRGSAGQPLRLLGTAMDISTRKQSEHALKDLANTDFLTGTASRRHFFEIGEKEFERAKRYQTPLSLLALDLDHFKHINDQLGHAGGDQVLKSAVSTISQFLRQPDIFGRTGGEEFCILLPETPLTGATSLAQRILDAIRHTPATLESGVAPFSLSIGIAEQTEANLNFEALMRSADKALYRAKSLGRDRAETAER